MGGDSLSEELAKILNLLLHLSLNHKYSLFKANHNNFDTSNMHLMKVLSMKNMRILTGISDSGKLSGFKSQYDGLKLKIHLIILIS